MIVPLTREKFEQLLPRIATGPQYKYYWGKFPDFLQRLLISVVSAAIVLLVKFVLGLDFGPILFVLGLVGAFYWLWGPAFYASMRNVKLRRYKYSGFFRGRVLDWWISDKVVGKQETVNNKGELVIVENREKRINLEVGDETDFFVEISVPLRPFHKAIARGQVAELLVLSNRADLSQISEFTDVYIPSRDLWVSDYPYLRQDFFTETSRSLREDRDDRPRRRRRREYNDDYDDRRDERPRRREPEQRRIRDVEEPRRQKDYEDNYEY